MGSIFIKKFRQNLQDYLDFFDCRFLDETGNI